MRRRPRTRERRDVGAVTTDETGYESVKYYELIPLVIEALKEENKVSQEQARTIARQQAEIQQLTVANQAAKTSWTYARIQMPRKGRLSPAMKYRKLGNTGMEVSVLSFGASSLGAVFHEVNVDECIETVRTALYGGI